MWERKRWVGAVAGWGSFIMGLAVAGGAQMEPRQRDGSPQAGFVPVRLEGYANASWAVEFPAHQVSINGIPFDLIRNPALEAAAVQSTGTTTHPERES